MIYYRFAVTSAMQTNRRLDGRNCVSVDTGLPIDS